MGKMKELYEKVAKDSALQEKLSAILKGAEQTGEAATKEKLTAFAKEAGFDVTLEEMQDFFKKLADKKEGLLSDSELDMVAGGKGIGIAASVLTFGTSCGITSAAMQIADGNCKRYFEV